MAQRGEIPRSVAIIMDGNGRWARSRGIERVDGHVKGVEALRATIKAAAATGIEYLTVYAFSTENWGRPKEEVAALMELLGRSVVNESPELRRKGVTLRFIGDRTKLSEELQESLYRAEELTAGGESLTLVVAINYSSRDEITRAVRTLTQSGADITEQSISGALDTAFMPDPDLIIRTSGEMRLSNFLMWQASYAELYVTDLLWPDFGAEELQRALDVYKNRDRRFGVIKS